MFLVLIKTDAQGVQRHLPWFSTVALLTAEQLEKAATTELKQAQVFRAKPVSLSGQTVLCLDPTPPPGLEEWQVCYVSLRLRSGETSQGQGGGERV
jgi:hypothetical protein